MPSDYKSGYVAIVGKPNVGKSTILNYFLGLDLAIVTPKPETTRNKILGTLTTAAGQINFIDTPGIHMPHTLLGKHMVRQAKEALQEADVVLAVIDASKPLDRSDSALFANVRTCKKDTILLLNKVDLVDKRLVLPVIEECSKMGIFKDFIPVSAKKGDNMQSVLAGTLQLLPENPKFFPDDHLTDKPQRFFIAESIRKEVLSLTREEIPYSVAVLVEEVKERPQNNITYVQAVIFTERPTQKAIIIGKKANMLKAIGEAARLNIEKQLGTRVFLELWVKVYKNWRQDPRALKILGYA